MTEKYDPFFPPDLNPLPTPRYSAKQEARRRKEKLRKAEFYAKNQTRVERKLRHKAIKGMKKADKQGASSFIITLSNYDAHFLTGYLPCRYVTLHLPEGWGATEELGGAYGSETVITVSRCK